jgi:hypothetical protein
MENKIFLVYEKSVKKSISLIADFSSKTELEEYLLKNISSGKISMENVLVSTCEKSQVILDEFSNKIIVDGSVAVFSDKKLEQIFENNLLSYFFKQLENDYNAIRKYDISVSFNKIFVDGINFCCIDGEKNTVISISDEENFIDCCINGIKKECIFFKEDHLAKAKKAKKLFKEIEGLSIGKKDDDSFEKISKEIRLIVNDIRFDIEKTLIALTRPPKKGEVLKFLLENKEKYTDWIVLENLKVLRS